MRKIEKYKVRHVILRRASHPIIEVEDTCMNLVYSKLSDVISPLYYKILQRAFRIN